MSPPTFVRQMFLMYQVKWKRPRSRRLIDTIRGGLPAPARGLTWDMKEEGRADTRRCTIRKPG